MKNSGNFTMISNETIRNPELSIYAKVIYFLIKSYSPSYPSYARIIQGTGIKSKTTISKGLHELKCLKLIRVVDSPNHKSNLYEFPSNQMNSSTPSDGPKLVHEMDTNNTNLTKPNNNTNRPSTDPPVEAAKVSKILAEAASSLGTEAKQRYRQKKRPTFIIEDSKQDV